MSMLIWVCARNRSKVGILIALFFAVAARPRTHTPGHCCHHRAPTHTIVSSDVCGAVVTSPDSVFPVWRLRNNRVVFDSSASSDAHRETSCRWAWEGTCTGVCGGAIYDACVNTGRVCARLRALTAGTAQTDPDRKFRRALCTGGHSCNPRQGTASRIQPTRMRHSPYIAHPDRPLQSRRGCTLRPPEQEKDTTSIVTASERHI